LNTAFYRCLDQIFFSHHTSIIMYHGLTDREGQLENYHGKHLHIKTFKKHLQHLKKFYSIIPLRTFVDHCLYKTPMPKNPVVLTFDDGYESNFTLGFPVLREFDAPATIFLSTDFIEQKQFIWPNRVEFSILSTQHSSLRLPFNNEERLFDLSHDEARIKAVDTIKPLMKLLNKDPRNDLVDTIERSLEQKLNFNAATPAIHRPLTWQQIQEMSRSKLVDFGAHTCSHENLAACPLDLLTREITVSKKIIEERTCASCPLFCYPYGGQEAFNGQTKESLQKAGYTAALTTITGSNDARSDLFTLKRLGTSNSAGMDNFEDKLLKSRRSFRRLYKKLL
jgi:peptidoglycan/xylan/chitin deacetylase (PgdA/CDA1 family)